MRAVSSGAVEPVSGQGMADGGHVQPQLVGAPGLGHQLHKAQSVMAGEHLVVRHGGSASGRIMRRMAESGSRPMGASMVPDIGSGHPTHTARYSR